MNDKELAAVKQALEALMVFRYAPPAQRPLVLKAITALQSIIAQDALHRLAEESRTNGLRLDDWDKIGCVNHDCDKCKAVQEPRARLMTYIGKGPYPKPGYTVSRPTKSARRTNTRMRGRRARSSTPPHPHPNPSL
jgi:hypothetical protein